MALNGDLCSTSVMDIECQRADGSAAQLTGQVIHCKERVGVYCRNTEQTGPNKICDDYRFRFLCSNIERPGEFIDLKVFFPRCTLTIACVANPLNLLCRQYKWFRRVRGPAAMQAI